MNELVLSLHLFATFALVGLIWVTQLITYPLMDAAAAGDFAAYHARYSRRITALVGILMPLELVTGLALFLIPLPGVPLLTVWLGFLLILLIWASTALLQVPQHTILARGYDALAHRRLVRTNWIRTAAWTLRGLLLLLVVAV